MNPVRSFIALVKFHVAACLTTPRWLVVAPVYVLAFISLIHHNRRDEATFNPVQMGSNANVWDVGLTFLNDIFNDCFLILLGFILLVGDDFVRDYNAGTLRSTLLLSRSPQRWWYTKVVSIGVRAIAYMSIIFVSMIIAALVMRIPLELGSSEASVAIAKLRQVGRWYDLPPTWSTSRYAMFSFFSLTFSIWIIAVVQQVTSLFVFPNRRIPFIVFFAWLILGFSLNVDASFWDARFLLYPGKCFPDWGEGMCRCLCFSAR
jgi:hypothetical protein